MAGSAQDGATAPGYELVIVSYHSRPQIRMLRPEFYSILQLSKLFKGIRRVLDMFAQHIPARRGNGMIY